MSWAEARAQTAGLPEVFGILHRHFPGDQALLQLAQAQLECAGMGAEVYPGTVDEALAEWPYVPSGLPRHVVHLPRNWDIFSSSDRGFILAFAHALAGRVRGLVFHDQPDWAKRSAELIVELGELNERLQLVAGQPMLYLEYAAGLDPGTYASIVERMAPLNRISACIDTGHVTIFVANRWMAARHPDLPLAPLDPLDVGVASIAADLAAAGQQATDELVAVVDRIARLGKPVHFHLHDGHLLSRLSRYGVRDHLPFGTRIPVSPAASPDGTLSTFLGTEGLGRVLAAARAELSAADVSLTLEIHPHLQLMRKPLGPLGSLFSHWADLANAELTHAWLDQVTEQAALVRRLWLAL